MTCPRSTVHCSHRASAPRAATPQDLRAVFGDSLPNVLPSYSREVLGQGPDVASLRVAAARAVDECRAVLG